jgi:hypothetical protein
MCYSECYLTLTNEEYANAIQLISQCTEMESGPFYEMNVQGGSNMTGTCAACLHTNQSRSYLNHLVQSKQPELGGDVLGAMSEAYVPHTSVCSIPTRTNTALTQVCRILQQWLICIASKQYKTFYQIMPVIYSSVNGCNRALFNNEA